MRPYESVRGHASVCEDMQGLVRAASMCEGVQVCVRLCEDPVPQEEPDRVTGAKRKS